MHVYDNRSGGAVVKVHRVNADYCIGLIDDRDKLLVPFSDSVCICLLGRHATDLGKTATVADEGTSGKRQPRQGFAV